MTIALGRWVTTNRVVSLVDWIWEETYGMGIAGSNLCSGY